MEQENDNLESLLSEVVEQAQSEQIVYIDIDELELNPKNFYGLRDIDTLAGLIAVSHLIEPLTVIKNSETDKYRIISGHRRYSAVKKLLEEGVYTERKLPCIVKKYVKVKIEQENGETIEFDEESVEMLNLIAANRGQREERTLEEKLQEIKYLEKFAKAIYHQKRRGSRGRFRNFFAEEVLNISAAQLKRMNMLSKLTDKVKAALDEKKISESVGLELSGLTEAEQDACLAKILSGRIMGTVEAIQRWKNRQKEKNDNDEKYYDSFEIIFKHDKLIYPEESDEILFNGTKYSQKEYVDAEKAAEAWFDKTIINFYEDLLTFLNQVAEEEKEKNKSEQYAARAEVVRSKLEEFKTVNGQK